MFAAMPGIETSLFKKLSQRLREFSLLTGSSRDVSIVVELIKKARW